MPEQLTYIVGPNGQMQEAFEMPPAVAAVRSAELRRLNRVGRFMDDRTIVVPDGMLVSAHVLPTTDVLAAIHRGDPILVEVSGETYSVLVNRWSYGSMAPDEPLRLDIEGTVVASDP